MKKENKETGPAVVPPNIEGKPVDIERSVTEKSPEDAFYRYETARTLLLRPGMWEKVSGFAGAKLRLQKINRLDASPVMELNDYIMIDLVGPGPGAGEGFDWVTVENMEENFDPAADDSFSIRLRPCPDPDKDTKEEVAAHFFKDKATSTFIVKRKGKTVTVSYHGRNEIPNLKGANLHDKIRNSIVALGALSGLSELQWTSLVEGLLKESEDKVNK